jgi:hypothetical protein
LDRKHTLLVCPCAVGEVGEARRKELEEVGERIKMTTRLRYTIPHIGTLCLVEVVEAEATSRAEAVGRNSRPTGNEARMLEVSVNRRIWSEYSWDFQVKADRWTRCTYQR